MFYFAFCKSDVVVWILIAKSWGLVKKITAFLYVKTQRENLKSLSSFI